MLQKRRKTRVIKIWYTQVWKLGVYHARYVTNTQEQRGVDHNYTEELLSSWRVLIYMSVHGINLYHVKASAASVQRLLVSFWRYLANENYDLSSEGFYGTSTLVSSASCCSFAYVYTPTIHHRANRIGPAAPFTLFKLHMAIILPVPVDISVKTMTKIREAAGYYSRLI